MQNIYGITYDDLETYFLSINEKKYRASQIYEFIYQKQINDYNKMINIPSNIKEKLVSDFDNKFLEIIKKQIGENVNKYLFKLHDGNLIEAVLMFHDYGTSLCISSQVGCNMGCKFCESGRLKKVRNLESYEMVMQILLVEKDIQKRITHVVIMGIGEPFDNYDNVMKFIKIITHPKSINIGSRHITISTSGIVPKIKKFALEDGGVNLAVSLHAPNDKLRSSLMPINNAYNLKELMEAIKEYLKLKNRRVTFEYVMLNNINDTKKCAHELALLLKGINCYVNLIPYNETTNDVYKRSKKEKIMEFYDILKKNNIAVTIRKEFGTNIDAACGQLRANQIKEDK